MVEKEFIPTLLELRFKEQVVVAVEHLAVGPQERAAQLVVVLERLETTLTALLALR
jgi:endonuclease/exonuclease/phosphatase family metal-dependent hydrolase